MQLFTHVSSCKFCRNCNFNY